MAESEKLELVKLGVKIAASALPVVGGPIAEVLGHILQAPVEQRRAGFLEAVGERLKALEAGGLELESLGSSPAFVDASLQAVQIAMRTHQEAKLLALQNAILNVATGQLADETKQHMFLAWIDELTEMHLRILRVFQAPIAPPGMGMAGVIQVLWYNVPQLNNDRSFSMQLWRDLYSRGLVTIDNLNVTMSGNGLSEKRTSGLADEFLRFIEQHE